MNIGIILESIMFQFMQFFCKSPGQDSYDSIVEILPSKIRKNGKMPLSPKQLRFGILEYFY